MNKEINTSPLTDIEWDTLWMAISYANPRGTIACTFLPGQVITNYYHRLSYDQKMMIVSNLKKDRQNNGNMFGHNSSDTLVWDKFIACLDEINYFQVIDINGEEHTCFMVDNVFYIVKSYLETPHKEVYLPKENIKTVLY